ncbi:MAG: TonB-dependent siderophore receptor [Candidatus Methylophosphatis roskildensis]
MRNIRSKPAAAALLAAVSVGAFAQQAEYDSATSLPAMTVRGAADGAYRVPNASTATKTDTPLMETPFSVQVVPQQVLQDQLANRLEKALQNVPGVVPFSTNQGLSDGFMIRGFGSNTTYRDGFFKPDILGGGSSKGETANIERIEVLKGPGSILFGRTEPGGVINVVTKQPLAQRQTSIQQEIGYWSYYRTTLDTTGRLTADDTLLFRVNASYETTDSFRDFVEDKGTFIAPTLKFNISPRTWAALEFEYQKFDDTPDPGILPLDGRPANVPRSRVFFEPRSNVNKGDRQLLGLTWSHAFNDAWSLRHRISAERFDLKNLTLFSGELQSDGSLDRFFNNGGDQESKRLSTALDLSGRFATGPLKHTLLIGADYFRVSDKLLSLNCCDAAPAFNFFNPTYNPASQVFDPANNFDLDFKQKWYGLYAQDQIDLPGNLHALVGVRYDNAEGKSGGVVTDSDHRTSPRGGLVWRPMQWLSLYGSYSENFGASNSLFNPPNRRLPSQTARQWELGAKTELMDGRLSATVALYDLTKKNLQAADPVNPSITVAIGEARSRGVEFDLTGELAPGWNVIAGYAWMPSAKITKDSQQEFDDDGNVSGTNAGRTGYRLFLAPRHQGSLWTTYEFRSGSLLGLKFGAGVVAVSQRYGDPDVSYILPGYGVSNLMASYAFKVGATKLTAQVNVDNVFDRTHFVGSNSGSFITVGNPRTVKGSLRVDF